MAADLEVVELGPEHVDDYLALFDAAFREFPDWAGCYCAFYDAPAGQPFDPQEEGAQHRADREARIRSGRAHGLLAYRDGAPVGWCNVAPRSQVPNLRKFAEAVVDPADEPAVVMCFVIHPDHRGQGVASDLLAGALDAARRWGTPWWRATQLARMPTPTACRGPLPSTRVHCACTRPPGSRSPMTWATGLSCAATFLRTELLAQVP